jgi:hypothetical protein
MVKRIKGGRETERRWGGADEKRMETEGQHSQTS